MLTFKSASEITVFADPSMDWTLDGEQQNGCEKIEIKNIKSAINLIC